MAKVKTKAFILPATYEAWVQLVDLHEAYSKHTPIAHNPGHWQSYEVCSTCGWVMPSHGKLEANLRQLFDQDIKLLLSLPVGKYILRRLAPAIHTSSLGRWYSFENLFNALPREHLEYLYDSCAMPWAAFALAKRTSSNMAAYRAVCLTSPATVYAWASMTGRSNDEERRAACADPVYANLYADHVDKEYHVVTRMAAMRTPSTAVSYLRSWGDCFTLTDAERKRVCRTKYGASTAAQAELKDRPEYRKALGNSQMYGDAYIYGIAGQRCKDMELGCRVSSGFDLVEYLAVFDIDMADMGLSGYRHSPHSHRLAGKIYDSMLVCKELAAHMGTLTPDDILTLPFKMRSAMAAGYIYATRACTPELWAAASRNRTYKWSIVNLDWRIGCANIARARQGMPLISSSIVGIPADTRRKP